MDKIDIKTIVAGDKVIYKEIPSRNPNRYSLATVEKVNGKSIVVNGKRFTQRMVGSYTYNQWVAKKERHGSYEYEILPYNSSTKKKIQETIDRDAREKVARENKEAEEATAKSELEAFLATDEGKAYTELTENWVGMAVTIVPRHITSQGREARVYIYPPNKNGYNNEEYMYANKVAEIEIRQMTKYYSNYDVEPRVVFSYLDRCSIRGYSSFDNPFQAEKYMEALEKAITVATIWDAETGKKWDTDALVAVDAPCEIPLGKGW